NSWVEEPETRLPLSGPVKRRCRIINMPNVLLNELRQSGTDGIARVGDTILKQGQDAARRRLEAGRQSTWAKHRNQRLSDMPSFDRLEDRTRRKLLQLCQALLENVETRNFFTVGILRDILLSCVYTRAGGEYAALGEQVADKILHQLQ